MTSGNFHSVPIDKIKVDRENRQRRELTDIHVLADSISRLGLIHPIVIDRNFALVAGERRLEALKLLGHDSATCQYTDEIDYLTHRQIELEENVKRVDLTWQEQCAAVNEYHDIRYSQDPEWTVEKTAAAMGLEDKVVYAYLSIDRVVKDGHPEIMDAPILSKARGAVARINERHDQKALRELDEYVSKGNDEPRRSSIVNADFAEWVLTYDGPRFNFIHCDFPFGIGADKMQQGRSVLTHGGYDDTPENYWHLLTVLCNNVKRICTESAHIMFWFSMHNYSDTLDFFANHSDFTMDAFPLVWLKSDGVGLLPDPQRGPRRIYETCLFGHRGDRKIVSSVANAYAAPTDRTQHMSTKPEPVLRHFFRMFVDENSVVLDPTCGSGSALRAAESLGAAYTLGIEINRDFTERANLALERMRVV